MSAPIPAPVRPRPLSLAKLIHAPGASVGAVQAALETVFPRVVVEMRDEPFYQFHLRCGDASGRNRLIVRFGWCERRARWTFEPLPGDRA